MMLITLIAAIMLEVIPAGQAFFKPLQQRDSVLIADQFKYGFKLEDTKDVEGLTLQDFSQICNDTLVLVRGWQIDTVSTKKQLKEGKVDVEWWITVAPFEEGRYELPDIYVVKHTADGSDTLCFEAPEPFEVKTMPVDTTTFVPHDIKDQINYPVTLEEVLPYIGGGIAGLWIITAIVVLIVYFAGRKKKAEERRDPAHIVALRKLDKYRSDKYWAPDKQKAFYSGITGAVKEYIDERFAIDAPEMTTAELFDALQGRTELTPELYEKMKELFERADFVKFAKYVADDAQNAEALPLCVRFVTSTYQAEIEEEAHSEKDVL
ncbi:MAG: hypothetical protein J5748_04720 [Bacteroidales bacterium]|nr:hypothetical protein [Bacteroidales bacterium]